jgi:hypothetical protein
VMGPDKWEVVKSRVSKEDAISMFNFKEGPKRKMLKVQYFKHPNIAGHLYNRFLAAYGKFHGMMRFHITLLEFFMHIFSWACTLIIPAYHPNIMGLVKDEHMIERGISKCNIAEASTTFGISPNMGICFTFRDASYIRCWQGGQECNQKKI